MKWLSLFALIFSLFILRAEASPAPFPKPLDQYPPSAEASLWTTLQERVADEPFNLVAAIIFFLAICHTFAAPALTKLAHKIQHDFEIRTTQMDPASRPPHDRSILGNGLHYLGEVEAVFGLWALFLFLAIIFAKGYGAALDYVNHQVHYTEPIFVVVIMTIASSGPILRLAQQGIALVAGRSPAGWWLSILILGPLLGSFITEPAAMTISALLLAKEFYTYKPSIKFQYATLGLLFVNISVGGTMTHFAAPPVLMVATKWGWSTPFMFTHFGLRAIVGILLSTAVYFIFFRQELAVLAQTKAAQVEDPNADESIPVWITGLNLAFLAGAVWVAHYPVLVVGGFLFFLAFTAATSYYQGPVEIRSPLLVGFFLAGLVVHGGLQAWWIQPVLSRLGETPLLLGATLLTAFNDNAAITYLASLVPDFTDPLKFAVMSGAVCGGGLTVIANAPNPAGQSILSRFFEDGVAPVKLALGALFPTAVMMLCFGLFR
jgi:hypothetical protein